MAGNNKINNVEKARRIRIVQEYILLDIHYMDMVNKCVQSWGVSEIQAKRYIREANDGFKKITEKNMERRLNYHIQKRMKLLRQLDPKYKNTPQGVKAELEIVKDMADLERLYEKKHIISGEGGKPIEIKHQSDIDYDKLPDEVLEAILNARKTHHGR